MIIKERLEILEGNKLLYQVLDMDETIRSHVDDFTAKNGWQIRSFQSSILILATKTIFIRGEAMNSDLNASLCYFDTFDEADAVKDNILSAFHEWAESLNIPKTNGVNIFSF